MHAMVHVLAMSRLSMHVSQNAIEQEDGSMWRTVLLSE